MVRIAVLMHSALALLKKAPVFFTLWVMPMFQSYNAVQLFEPIVEILEEHVQGLSEHKLLYALSDRGFLEFNPQLLSEELSLFQTHFFLFHVLYRLRDLLHEQQRYELEIFCLEIRLKPYRDAAAQGQGLAQIDPLREYYLDLKELHDTDAAEVRLMLNGFYQRLEAYEQRREALDVLGLEESVHIHTVRRRYKALVKQHHPDHGGDREKFHAVENAMELLSRLYE